MPKVQTLYFTDEKNETQNGEGFPTGHYVKMGSETGPVWGLFHETTWSPLSAPL